ncbi:protein of unknown function [Caballeronia sp. S22]
MRGDRRPRGRHQRGSAHVHQRRAFLRRQVRAHGRRPCEAQRAGRRRRNVDGAAEVPRTLQLPVRLLHAGLRQRDDRADRKAQAQSDRERPDRSDDHGRAERAHLPLHRLCALLRSGQGSRARHARTREGRRMMRSILTRVVAPLVAASFALAGCGGHNDMATPPKSSPEQIARGRYLAHAADCAACHTAPGGAPFAGGVKLESQFGTFYGTNITPDPKHGIGMWSADEFYGALHDGVTPKHKTLSRDAVHVVPADVARGQRRDLRVPDDAKARGGAERRIRSQVSIQRALRRALLGHAVSEGHAAGCIVGTVRRLDARALSGQRAGPLRGMPLAARRVRPDAGRADVAGRHARAHRGAGHHADRARRARLDGRGSAGVLRNRRGEARFRVRRDASRDLSEHAAPERR